MRSLTEEEIDTVEKFFRVFTAKPSRFSLSSRFSLLSSSSSPPRGCRFLHSAGAVCVSRMTLVLEKDHFAFYVDLEKRLNEPVNGQRSSKAEDEHLSSPPVGANPNDVPQSTEFLMAAQCFLQLPWPEGATKLQFTTIVIDELKRRRAALHEQGNGSHDANDGIETDHVVMYA